jgi:predicted MFS family arabinose efflux permease
MPGATPETDADTAAEQPTPWGRLAVLFMLYFVQGLPYGFQSGALIVYLRGSGVSLGTLGVIGLVLPLPWVTKILWAPLVDRWSVRSLGRRRSWILPLQLALAAACAAAAFTEPESQLVPLLVLVLCMNLFAATMDIAVDGLAVDQVAGRQLGYVNIAQVVGYKVGILTAGGVLLMLSERIGWQGMLASMAGLVLACFLVTLVAVREPDPAQQGAPETIPEVLGRLVRAINVPGVPWLLLFIASYKFGESMSDSLFRPFLVDAGFTRGQIGLWMNTYGTIGSLAGSLLGGVLAVRVGLLRALTITAVLRVAPIAGLLLLVLGTPTAAGVIAVTVAENFFGGALTTAMFAYMMSRVDRTIGATHFTLFATVEVLGKMIAGSGANMTAGAIGYVPVLSLALALSVAFLGLLVPMARQGRAALASGRIVA